MHGMNLETLSQPPRDWGTGAITVRGALLPQTPLEILCKLGLPATW